MKGTRGRPREGEAAPAVEEAGQLLGEDIGKMEERSGKRKTPMNMTLTPPGRRNGGRW
jgi:hypothetical protein